jgi:MoaA/NifB/PqqE/SkfB family radical SAM enzyme|tara:strand:- start:455 stop:1531 length:1077 start_codon:yes stop_codon:yes gene_type:complete
MATVNFENGYMRYSGDNPFGTQAKMLHHLKLLNEYLETGDTTGPVFMEVNPTNRCNLACSWCISENSRGEEEIEIGALERFFKDFKVLGGKALTFSGGGEPTFYRHFERAVESSKGEDLELGLMTDGVYKSRYSPLIGESFQWARFSLDTLDEANYEKCKGHNTVPQVLANIEALKEYPINVGVNCNLGDNLSVEEVQELVNWFVETKPADYLQFRPILHRYFKGEHPLINEDAWDYLDTVRGTLGITFSDDKLSDIRDGNAFPFRSCEGHYFEPVLHATGEVQVCMYHPRDSRFTFGNIHESSFREIWESQQRQESIEFTRKFDYAKGCQFSCKLTEPNKLLDFLNHPEEAKDINFL